MEIVFDYAKKFVKSKIHFYRIMLNRVTRNPSMFDGENAVAEYTEALNKYEKDLKEILKNEKEYKKANKQKLRGK